MSKKGQAETIIDVLNGIIEEEEERIRASYPHNDVFQKKIALFELIRSFDSFFAFSQKNKDIIHYYRYGWNRALRLLYGKYTNEMDFPLCPVNKHSCKPGRSCRTCTRLNVASPLNTFPDEAIAISLSL